MYNSRGRGYGRRHCGWRRAGGRDASPAQKSTLCDSVPGGGRERAGAGAAFRGHAFVRTVGHEISRGSGRNGAGGIRGSVPAAGVSCERGIRERIRGGDGSDRNAGIRSAYFVYLGNGRVGMEPDKYRDTGGFGIGVRGGDERGIFAGQYWLCARDPSTAAFGRIFSGDCGFARVFLFVRSNSWMNLAEFK